MIPFMMIPLLGTNTVQQNFIQVVGMITFKALLRKIYFLLNEDKAQ